MTSVHFHVGCFVSCPEETKHSCLCGTCLFSCAMSFGTFSHCFVCQHFHDNIFKKNWFQNICRFNSQQLSLCVYVCVWETPVCVWPEERCCLAVGMAGEREKKGRTCNLPSLEIVHQIHGQRERNISELILLVLWLVNLLLARGFSHPLPALFLDTPSSGH